MKGKAKMLKEIIDRELELKLYDIKIQGISVWRLLRFQVRKQKLKSTTGFTNRTTRIKLNFASLLLSYTKSFFQLVNLLTKRKKYKHIVFGFPRLVKYEGIYFDKFTDPIIEQSSLKEDTLVVQRNLSGKQFSPRFKSSSNLILSDFIDYTSKALSILCIPLFFIRYRKSIGSIEQKAKQYFRLGDKFSFKVAFKIGEFFFISFFVKILYRVTECKNIILVDREMFLPHISMTKKMGIKSFELQHGITHSETVLYSGKYQKEIDPDYFLVFGEKWKGAQFSIPLKQMYNIGWAYKTWISGKIKNKKIEDTVLVVSSPAITEKILKTLYELAEEYKNYEFVLRLHPQEELKEEQMNRVKTYHNIEIDAKDKDSIVSVLTYQYCIGENSSVLYEALSFGKKVAKIMYNGLSSKGAIDVELKGFFYLNGVEDFKLFVEESGDVIRPEIGVYDDFNANKFDNIVNKIEA